MRHLLASAILLTLVLASAPPAAALSYCDGVPHDCQGDAMPLPDQRPATFTLDTTRATKERLEPEPCVLSSGTVWAKFTAVTSGVARISLDEPSQADFGLVAYRQSGSQGPLKFVTCGSHYAQGKGEIHLRIDCVAGTTYYLQMGAYTQGPATFRLTGCGATGTGIEKRESEVLTSSSLGIRSHEAGEQSEPCIGKCDSTPLAGYDLDVAATLNGRGLYGNGPLVDLHFEATARAIGVDTNSGGLVVDIGGPPKRPPPPPPCGAGCTPGDILEWLFQMPPYVMDDAMIAHVEHHA